MSAERSEWLRIEIRHLAALAAVARESSFSGAADSLGYVQSAVSQQIGFLERIVGRRLVERAGRPRSVGLTEAGAVLVDHADEILGRLRAAKEEIDAMTRGSAHPPAFGLASTLGRRVAASVVAAAGAEGWTRVERGPVPALLAQVESGALDGAFVELPLASGPFFAMELLREPYVLAVPARPGEHAFVAVDGCPLLPGRAPAHRVQSAAAALSFVRAGIGAAVVPEGDVPPGADIRLIGLPGVPPRVVGLAWRRDRPAPSLERREGEVPLGVEQAGRSADVV